MATANGSANGPVAAAVEPQRPATIAEKLSGLAQAVMTSLSHPARYPNVPTGVDAAPETGILADVWRLGFSDYKTLLQTLNASVTGVEDDNTLLLENLVSLLSRLPPDSRQGKELSDGFINQLWTGLDHPPVSNLGTQFKYRQPDGSYNNVHLPKLGAAGQPYARSVPALVPQSPDLPATDLIFDMLMARDDTFTPHPNGLSSVLFYLANIIIHDIFQTSPDDFSVNLTSSYLDLSPLYGRNEDEQREMRTFKDGLLKPDCFSSKRILGFPPGCSVFLIMFNRFHNYVVTQLAIINESGRFTKPAPSGSADAWKKYDEDLFQTGRLITCGLYANIILKDYVRTILSLNRSGSLWSLDPRVKEGKNIFSKVVPEGVGNQVSAEFNLIYRWHSVISQRDEQWTVNEFARMLPGQDPATASMGQVLGALGKFEDSLPAEPEKRPVAGLTRLSDGTFDDDALVKIFTADVEDPAGAYGANKVPNCLKSIEVLGMLQARHWNVATLNEFREFVGLTRHATFEDINPDPEVAKKLSYLYDSPDSVELYPGLVAEKPKPPMTPGSGLCVNYTTSRAILADAVALVRGDRFFTIDYTPKSVTNWGYNEANYDLTVNQGHVMHKLIYRAFPKHFANNSIYAHFPMVTPQENLKILNKLHKAYLYSWEAPRRQGDLVVIKSNKACQQILDDKVNYKVTWGDAIKYLTTSDRKVYATDFALAGDKAANAANRQHIMKALYPAGQWYDDISRFYGETAAGLLDMYSFPLPFGPGKGAKTKSREVDIVRDVIALANTRFMGDLFNLPLKTEKNPRGVFTEQQLFLVLTVCFASIFFDADPANSFKVRTAAQDLAQKLGQLVLINTNSVVKGFGVAELLKFVVLGGGGGANAAGGDPRWPSLRYYGDHMLQRMMVPGQSVEESVWGSVMPVTAAGVANQTQNLSQAVEYYLTDGKAHLQELYRLAHANTKEADDLLMKYMLEGCRLRATVAVYRDLATDQTVSDYSPSLRDPADPSEQNPRPNPDPSGTTRTLKLPAGTRVLVNLMTANHDAAAFPDPETVRTDRPVESYMHFGWGPHECLGRQASRVGLTALFKQIFGLKNIRVVDGNQGKIKSFPVAPWNGQVGATRNPDEGWMGIRTYMTADQSSYWPLPSTLKVRWDE